MPPGTSLARPLRSLARRPRIDAASAAATTNPLRAAPRRYITASQRPLPVQDKEGQPGPNQDQLPHVSEEAAEVSRVTGETGPDLSQGTPVEEVLARDEDGLKNAPEVLKDEVEKNSGSSGGGGGGGGAGTKTPSGTRSYSTSARRRQELVMQAQASTLPPPPSPAGMVPFDEVTMAPATAAGHKFGLPDLPLGQFDHKDYRYDPCVKQITALLMKDGKLSKAQTNMARILNHLRTSAPPKINSERPMLPGAPPPAHLPLNPALYLQLAVDSVAPLFRLRSQKGLVGGGVSVSVPSPLNLKQRRRQAFQWVLDAVDKKPSRSSGKGMFAQKVADELIAIVEGKSGVWEKRLGVHKLGTAARSNLGKKGTNRPGMKH